MKQNTISPEQALQNLSQVAASYRGTAQEHDLLRQSVEAIAKAIAEPSVLPGGS
jgi:predicted RNase H-like HicB family nuclease